MLKRTPFYDFHNISGARMVDFAGWEMPIMYKSIVEEHNQTRTSGSIFDVSHMGRVQFKGPDARKLLDHLCTRSLEKCEIGQSKYSLVCNAAGGVMDDVIVGRDEKHWIMVVNASNREKLLKHFQDIRRSDDFDCDIADNTESTAMIALQGPKVLEKVAGALPTDVKSLKRFRFVSDSYMLVKYTVFRSGYTGEDGVEMILPARMAGMAMKLLAGRLDREDATLRPAGLGARDTLRLEAGLPLYGHELGEDIDPLTASLGWAVDLDKDFIGAEALRKIKADGPARKLVGLRLEGKRIARQGAPIFVNAKQAGIVTSGTFSPTLQQSIAMAFLDIGLAEVGTEVAVDLRGEFLPATVVPLPFYKRTA